MAKRKTTIAAGLTAARGLELDELDWKLLARLQQDARVSTADLAREFNLSAPGVQKRVRRLEAKGVVLRYATVLNREAIGLDLLCVILIMLAHHRADSVQRFLQSTEGIYIQVVGRFIQQQQVATLLQRDSQMNTIPHSS